GDRQKGRIKAKSVIDTKTSKKEIVKAFEKVYSDEFQTSLKKVKNPYGNGCASKEIITILKNVDLKDILKKSFYDIGIDYETL
ncbi:MAG: UDP-N-acetylglucosamine 2-epimerase, partial [Campylobacterales bacterium]